MVGWPGGGRFPYPVERILELELDVRGVRRYANAFPAAISLIAGRRVDAGALITHRFPLEKVVEAFQFVAENKDKVIKAVVLNQ
jgi:threonine dehydrogenase-like Zn-dependent dehydrogenase